MQHMILIQIHEVTGVEVLPNWERRERTAYSGFDYGPVVEKYRKHRVVVPESSEKWVVDAMLAGSNSYIDEVSCAASCPVCEGPLA